MIRGFYYDTDVIKVYGKDIFHISDHFIKVVFPFSVTGSHRGIDNGIDNGTDNGTDNGIDDLLVILTEKVLLPMEKRLFCYWEKLNAA